MHVPGCGKNSCTARATPAPAWSISASTWTPRAKAASSASRICAELKIGESNQSSAAVVDFSFVLFFLAESVDVVDDFFWLLVDRDFEDFFLECLEREISGSRTRV